MAGTTTRRRHGARSWRRRLGVASLLLALAIALPVGWIELGCRAPIPGLPAPAAAPAVAPTLIADPAHRLPPGNTVLAFPEWAIVYAYRDLAAVLADGDEADFPYLATIAGWWRGFCACRGAAAALGDADASTLVMLHVIGLSFTAELAGKGAYETTLGALGAWWRGPDKTPEDRFAAAMAADYAGFLDQQPWYAYPFGRAIRGLLRETPLGGSVARGLERRIALTAEWGFKAGYALVLGGGAALDPAVPEIRSVVRGLTDDDLRGLPMVRREGAAGDGLSVIVSPRYAVYREILVALAGRGRDLVEIAGNRVILLTALVPPEADAAAVLPGAVRLIDDPLPARPGWRRLGLLLPVPALAAALRALPGQGAKLEHVYDY